MCHFHDMSWHPLQVTVAIFVCSSLYITSFFFPFMPFSYSSCLILLILVCKPRTINGNLCLIMWIISGLYLHKWTCVGAFVLGLYKEKMQMAQQEKGSIFGNTPFLAWSTQGSPMSLFGNVRDEHVGESHPRPHTFISSWQLTNNGEMEKKYREHGIGRGEKRVRQHEKTFLGRYCTSHLYNSPPSVRSTWVFPQECILPVFIPSVANGSPPLPEGIMQPVRQSVPSKPSYLPCIRIISTPGSQTWSTEEKVSQFLSIASCWVVTVEARWWGLMKQRNQG